MIVLAILLCAALIFFAGYVCGETAEESRRNREWWEDPHEGT